MLPVEELLLSQDFPLLTIPISENLKESIMKQVRR